jgi:hypothetical protein
MVQDALLESGGCGGGERDRIYIGRSRGVGLSGGGGGSTRDWRLEYIKLDFGYKKLVAVPSRRVSVRQQALWLLLLCGEYMQQL